MIMLLQSIEHYLWYGLLGAECWGVCTATFEWGWSHQQYLQKFGLRVGEIPAAELGSQSSPNEDNPINRAANLIELW